MRISIGAVWRRLGVLALVGAIITVAPAATPRAGAQTKEQDVDRRIKELEDSLRELRKDTRKLEVADEDRSKAKPLAGWQDGFFLQSQDGNYKLKIGGYTQLDGRYFISDNPQVSQFLVRRGRIDLQGTVAKYFDFRLMPDFAGSSLVLFDAWVNVRYWKEAQLEIGKFKPPVGLERLQSATALTFVERAMPTNLVPNRDLGIMLNGELWRGVLSYQAGIFNGARDGGNVDGDVNDDKDVDARIFVQPFKDLSIEPLRGLGVGVSGTYGHQKGSTATTDLPSFKTPAQATFFSYVADSPATAAGTAIADGDRQRVSPQGYYYWRSLGLLGEYVKSDQRVTKGPSSNNIDNDAWQIAAMYVLTGENASFKGVTPDNPLDPFQGTWGAVELAARCSALSVDKDAFALGYADIKRSAREAREWTLGVNWYLNKNVKAVLNYDETHFTGGAAAGSRKTEKVILSRVQLLL